MERINIKGLLIMLGVGLLIAAPLKVKAQEIESWEYKGGIVEDYSGNIKEFNNIYNLTYNTASLVGQAFKDYTIEIGLHSFPRETGDYGIYYNDNYDCVLQGYIHYADKVIYLRDGLEESQEIYKKMIVDYFLTNYYQNNLEEIKKLTPEYQNTTVAFQITFTEFLYNTMEFKQENSELFKFYQSKGIFTEQELKNLENLYNAKYKEITVKQEEKVEVNNTETSFNHDVLLMLKNDIAKKLYKEGRITFSNANYITEDIIQLNIAFNLIDKDVLELFYDKGWKIEFVDNICTDSSRAGMLTVGSCFYQLKKIQILNYIDTSMKKTIIHEFGHFMDYSQDFYSDEKEFLNIYYSYISNYPCRDYAKETEREFLSDLLVDYYLNYDKIDDYPTVLDSVENLINSF